MTDISQSSQQTIFRRPGPNNLGPGLRDTVPSASIALVPAAQTLPCLHEGSDAGQFLDLDESSDIPEAFRPKSKPPKQLVVDRELTEDSGYRKKFQRYLVAHLLRDPALVCKLYTNAVSQDDFSYFIVRAILVAALEVARSQKLGGASDSAPIDSLPLAHQLQVLINAGQVTGSEVEILKDEFEEIYKLKLQTAYFRAELPKYLAIVRMREILQKSEGKSPQQIIDALRGIQSSVGQASYRPTVRSIAEIQNMDIPEDDFIIPGYLNKGDPMAIIGAPGVGKSRLVRQLAIDCILGRPFLGLQTNGRDTRWLILQMEDGNARLKSELNAMLGMFHSSEQMRRDYQRLNNQMFIHTLETDLDGFLTVGSPSKRDQNSDNGMERIGGLIQDIQPDVIVFDVLGQFTHENLNDDVAMRHVCSQLIRVTRAGNPKRIPIFVHHGKPGKDAAGKAVGYDRGGFGRNSKVLYGVVRAQINIAPGAADSNETLIVASGKCNNGREFEPFAVTLDTQTMTYHRDDSVDVDAWKRETSGRQAGGRRPDAQALLALVPSEGTIAKNQLCKILAPGASPKIGQGKAFDLLKELLREGRAFEHRLSRRGTNPEIRIGRQPPDTGSIPAEASQVPPVGETHTET